MLIRAKAPLRISFAGGGTDVPPYPERRGGCVISSTIDRYAYVTIVPKRIKHVSAHSLDYGIKTKFHLGKRMVYDGELDLIKAALKVMGIKGGCDLFIHSDAPPGSGLGSSSAMVVAVVAALAKWKKMSLTPYEIAEAAIKIERQELKLAGGLQDQYAATFGGFNFIEFNKDTTVVNPLRIDPMMLNEFNYRFLLCFTGKTRLSANIVERQANSFSRGDDDVVDALEGLKLMAIQMKNHLLKGNFEGFGRLLDDAWVYKKKLDKQITTSNIDKLYEAAKKKGAIGGKILGAGGGGYLLLFCDFRKKHKVADALQSLGGEIMPFSFTIPGVQTWEAPK